MIELAVLSILWYEWVSGYSRGTGAYRHSAFRIQYYKASDIFNIPNEHFMV